MKLRLEKVTIDSNGKELKRSTIGEYDTELDAILALQEENQKLRKAGDDRTRIDMIQILESPKEKRLDS